jgi:hypothetical protein
MSRLAAGFGAGFGALAGGVIASAGSDYLYPSKYDLTSVTAIGGFIGAVIGAAIGADSPPPPCPQLAPQPRFP